MYWIRSVEGFFEGPTISQRFEKNYKSYFFLIVSSFVEALKLQSCKIGWQTSLVLEEVDELTSVIEVWLTSDWSVIDKCLKSVWTVLGMWLKW